MRIAALGLILFGALGGFSWAAPAIPRLGGAPFVAGMVVFYPGGPLIEKAITEPREVGWMVRGINPALRFLSAIGRAAHPGELIGGLNASTKALQSCCPRLAELILRGLNRIRNQASDDLHAQVNLAAQRKAFKDAPEHFLSTRLKPSPGSPHHPDIPAANTKVPAQVAAAA
ncbi:hypothetical protein PTTG_28550 [Puccinia triticina 1-1 BBBD Race 1]|uniref:Uncharacterized protein n=2 Tax=Puccinia triticina TaxID=208348 RepID=A0A0C4ERD0_PUCT1|nr:uncharacterized protein PtA15_13A227 [Puccinia triticina]OAV89769.1 hypothetical protein PTTG_28550 [Puccinia triticina 1-1 BBBD Race 1]WAQ90828.1 hypothetical protein PtA15_13A227 [Puccinia triticina]WAR61017.1 hypothetical protein PtB15_13B268 [Puccinia triticina]